jgi:hypothetical protein
MGNAAGLIILVLIIWVIKLCFFTPNGYKEPDDDTFFGNELSKRRKIYLKKIRNKYFYWDGYDYICKYNHKLRMENDYIYYLKLYTYNNGCSETSIMSYQKRKINIGSFIKLYKNKKENL